MFRRMLLVVAIIFFMLTLSGGKYGTANGLPLLPSVPTMLAEEADIVVYGGGLAGCAAAWKASLEAPDKQVAMLVPYPEWYYGGLATVGGQNFWDLRYWQQDGSLVQGGSFAQWLEAVGPFYNPRALAHRIAADLSGLDNLRTYWATDITGIRQDRQGRLQALVLRRLERDDSGAVVWSNADADDDGSFMLKAAIFIDASEDGRLSRLAAAGVTAGRADWPPEFLTADYVDNELRPRQQAATLMFKVTGVEPGQYEDMIFSKVEDCWGAYGGQQVYIKDKVLTDFNERYGPQGWALKPLNAAQAGPGSREWWINALLLFDVDGRANARDMETDIYPEDMVPGALDTDAAWQKGRQMLANPDFLTALRRFHGFGSAELVKDEQGQPVTGSMLYLRETVHTALDPQLEGPGGDDRNYALTTAAVYGAGQGPHEGADARNYVNRIGLGFYWQDVNAYTFADLKDEDGAYRWPVTARLRPDYPLTTPGPDAQPQNPVYLPFGMLLSPSVPNLLIPGYAAGVSSLAWASVRVLPNQCVFGDAAGVAAAYGINNDRLPGEFGDADIGAVRVILLRHGARVEK